MSDITEAIGQLDAILDDNGWVSPDGEIEFVKVEVDEDGEPVEEIEEEETEGVEPEEESDEDESEGGEAEEESEEGSEEDELFEIEIGDEVYEVNKEELLSGYLRNEELVKRQTELEAQAQEREAELEAEQARVADYLEQLLLEGNIVIQKYRNIDWDQLKSEDPDGYRQARLEFIEAQEQQQARAARREQIVNMHKKAQEIKHQAYLQSQHKLAEQLIPELKQEGFADQLVSFGKSIGYTEDEIKSISDAKALFVLNQARLYAESQVRKKAALEKKVSKDLPPVVKPGAPKTKAQESSKQRREAIGKLKTTHSLRDAASVLMDFV